MPAQQSGWTVNFTTIFAVSCLTLSVAIPGGLYIAGEAQKKAAVGGRTGPPSISLWVTTPAFTLIDTKGGRHRMVAAIGAHNKDEAVRVCKYLPIVRDRLQRFASAVRVTGSDAGQPRLAGDTGALAADLAEALGFQTDPKVKIIESRQPVQTVIKARPASCENGKLSA